MRHLLAAVLVAAFLLVSACGAGDGSDRAPIPAVPRGPVIVFSVPDSTGLDEAVEVVDARLQAAGLGRAELGSREPPEVLCRLLATVDVEDARRLARRLAGRGVLELRIVAPDAAGRVEVEKRTQLEDAYRTPPDQAWVAYAVGDDVLVETPEQTAERALQAARKSGADAAEIAELQAALDDVRRSDVFGGADIVAAEARPDGSGAGSVVYFEMAGGRKAAFHDFTERNRRRHLAIVIDGVVETMPVIVTPLPGEGIITGMNGFTPSEAAVLAAILGDDLVLPGDLELLRIEEPEPPGTESPR